MDSSKGSLLTIIKANYGISIRGIHNRLGINPANEEDRKKVWQVGQAIAELHRGKWINIEPATRQFFVV